MRGYREQSSNNLTMTAKVYKNAENHKITADNP